MSLCGKEGRAFLVHQFQGWLILTINREGWAAVGIGDLSILSLRLV